jgi:hypothetical protein
MPRPTKPKNRQHLRNFADRRRVLGRDIHESFPPVLGSYCRKQWPASDLFLNGQRCPQERWVYERSSLLGCNSGISKTHMRKEVTAPSQCKFWFISFLVTIRWSLTQPLPAVGCLVLKKHLTSNAASSGHSLARNPDGCCRENWSSRTYSIQLQSNGRESSTTAANRSQRSRSEGSTRSTVPLLLS